MMTAQVAIPQHALHASRLSDRGGWRRARQSRLKAKTERNRNEE